MLLENIKIRKEREGSTMKKSVFCGFILAALLVLCCGTVQAAGNITSSTTRWSGTITASGNVTIDNHDSSTTTNRVAVVQDTVLVLNKGANLTVPMGIYVPEGVTLTITGSGTLHAGTDSNGEGDTCENYCAGIGGGWYDSDIPEVRGANCGTIIIDLDDTGKIVANGSKKTYYEGKSYGGYGAGIGGGANMQNITRAPEGGSAGTIIIRGGNVEARGHDGGAGIGGGGDAQIKMGSGDGGRIIISGGNVIASSSHDGYYGGAGIGPGSNSPGGIVEISGNAHVTAAGQTGGAGISGENINIRGNVQVEARGGYGAAGIGTGIWKTGQYSGGNGTRIVISGGTVTATGGHEAAGIGSGWDVPCSEIIIENAVVTATGNEGGAGIGGGYMCDSGIITINSGTVTAAGGMYAAGIGGGWGGNGNEITINGGTVTATAVGKTSGILYGAGIGGGGSLLRDRNPNTNTGTPVGSYGGTITIHGGTVTAIGAEYAAGIGGGSGAAFDTGLGGNGGVITIDGGYVNAAGGLQGAGIGGGFGGHGGSITINGGEVSSYGGLYAAAIGGGIYGDGADTFINGGIVTAAAQSGLAADGRFEGAAIGAGHYSQNHGTLTLYDECRVRTGSDESFSWWAAYVEYLCNSCRNSYVKIEPCTEHDYSWLYGECRLCGHKRQPDISYVDTVGEAQSHEGYTAVKSDTARWESGWYAVTEDVTVSPRIEVAGDVHLVLCDDKTLNAVQGIHIPAGKTLTIWCQDNGTGALVASGLRGNDGIGKNAATGNNDTDTGSDSENIAGVYDSGGMIIINGGNVTATAEDGAAAISVGFTSPVIDFLARVTAGASESTAVPVAASDQISACMSSYVRIEPCETHQAENGSCLWCGMVNPVNHSLTGKGTSANPYRIRSSADWNEMARYTAAGGSTQHIYFRQTADISITTMLGTEEHPFEGNYNGDGKTIQVNLTSPEEGPAPFSRIKDATIERVHVTGTVNAQGNYGAGLVGVIAGGISTIRNCLVETAVISSAGYCGGVVGKGSGTTVLEGIAFTGSISGGNNAGILWGWSDEGDVTILNCLENGSCTTVNMNPVGLGNTTSRSIDYVHYMHPEQGSPANSWAGEGIRAYSISPGKEVVLDHLAVIRSKYDVSGINVTDYDGIMREGVIYTYEGNLVLIDVSYTGTEWIGAQTAFRPSAGEYGYDPIHNHLDLRMPGENVIIVVEENTEIPTFTMSVEEKDEENGALDCISVRGNESFYVNLSSALPPNIKSYTWYVLRFHVDMEPGLEFHGIRSIKLSNHPSIHKLVDGEDDPYTYWVTEAADHHSFNLYIKLTDNKYFQPGSELNAKCEIRLKHGQAVSGKAGNLIHARMAFENNPSYTTHHTPESSVVFGNYYEGGFYDEENFYDDEFYENIVAWLGDYSLIFTHAVMFRTVDEDGNALSGASYKLTHTGTGKTAYSTVRDGTVLFYELDNGEYILEETKAPSGYHAIEPIRFTLVPDITQGFRLPSERESIMQGMYVLQEEGTGAENLLSFVYLTFDQDENMDLRTDVTNRRVYNISVASGSLRGGTVTASSETAFFGDMITLTAVPDEGYVLDRMTVTDADGNVIPLYDETFYMPDKDVYVTAEFVYDLSGDGTEDDPWQVEERFAYPAMTGGWYEIAANTTVSERISVEGSVHLILKEGTTFTAAQGINVAEGNSLTISGSGTLNAIGAPGCAGIGGGEGENGGSLTIDGGIINATGSVWGAGIGGGKNGTGGNITINGGNVTAQCYDPENAEVGLAAGIGGGDLCDGGTILITGGTVYARGNRGSAGIGGGGYAGGGTITITGGSVTAIGSSYPNGRSGAGIGAGRVRNNATSGNSGTITITGGTIIAMGGENAQAIGLSSEVAANDSGTLTLGEMTVWASETSDSPAVSTERVTVCRGNRVRIEPCIHSFGHDPVSEKGICIWCGAEMDIPVFGDPDFTLPEVLSEIEEEAFEGAAMRIVLIPDTCTRIGDHAFRNCPNLRQIYIPTGCTIGEDVFEGCEMVYIYGTAGSPAETYGSSHANCMFIETSKN